MANEQQFLTTSRRNRLVIIVLASIAITVCLLADTFVTSREASEVAGTWVGYDDNRTYFGRLELFTNGTGLFALTFATNVADLYKVESWSIEKLQLKFSIAAIDKEAEPVLASGQAGYITMRLALASSTGAWHTAFTLLNEGRFNMRNELARDRIERFKQAALKAPDKK